MTMIFLRRWTQFLSCLLLASRSPASSQRLSFTKFAYRGPKQLGCSPWACNLATGTPAALRAPISNAEPFLNVLQTGSEMLLHSQKQRALGKYATVFFCYSFTAGIQHHESWF